MNWSLADVALDPDELITVMSTVPGAWAGLVAWMSVLEITVKPAAVVPNLTPVAPTKPQPVTETTVPPPVGPDVGLTLITVAVPL